MYRVYLGNLDSRVTEETLASLFEDHGLSVSNVVVKRGYAFADCEDQNTLDHSIDTLNGKVTYCGDSGRGRISFNIELTVHFCSEIPGHVAGSHGLSLDEVRWRSG